MPNFPQNLNDWSEYRPMVRWLSPAVLLKTAKKVIDSTLFGQYADRRLIQAALDSPISLRAILRESFGGKKGVCRKRRQDEIWVDYVADLGDGFDSTYAIAYLIGQGKISVNDVDLPRADCLIMGGDQVYPDASRDEYHKRMKRPYRAAFPRTSKPNAYHPPVYLIPGNHDWYDGLNLFLAQFCRGKKTPFGSWEARQRRSYFAIHLGKNWWMWGFDSQLGEDIDQPQSDYFTLIARKMPADSKVILCASVPTWLKADLAGDKKGAEEYYRGLGHIVGLIRDNCEGAKIPLVISGDLHHYSRYVGRQTGTHFVTAGGGGAFLHPTHQLKDQFEMIWTDSKVKQNLDIAIDSNGDKAIYPSPKVSRRLARKNLAFLPRNPEFCLLLGGLYWLSSLAMLFWDGYGMTGGVGPFQDQFLTQLIKLFPTPVSVLILSVLVVILYLSSEIRAKTPKWLESIIDSSKSPQFTSFWKISLGRVYAFVTSKKTLVTFLHAIAHGMLILLGTAAASMLAPLGSLYFLTISLIVLTVGFVAGGFVWGLYLTVASSWWGDESNAAFSALRLDGFRHFLRLRIDDKTLTIYPVGLDESPKRHDWKMSDLYVDADPDQNTPAIVPKGQALKPHLIDDQIVIDIDKIQALK